MSYDLLSFKEQRIQALSDAYAEQQKRISELETYIFELCQDDCPAEYKQVVKGVLWQTQEG